MPDPRDPIADFVMRQAPKEVAAGLQLLAKLRMPLHDKRTFEAQLAEMVAKADDATKATAELVGATLDASDFPILSTESAFEKYWGKFEPFPFRVPLLPPIDLPVGPVQRPGACEVYRKTFGPAAGDCACRAYIEALRQGMNEYQAVIVGHFAGRRAQQTGECAF
jgi:hypothetical protein